MKERWVRVVATVMGGALLALAGGCIVVHHPRRGYYAPRHAVIVERSAPVVVAPKTE